MTSAQCPTCSGPIEFKAGSSFLVVCPHCNSAIARKDRKLEDLGKVAALVDTDSPLRVGLSGKYFDVPFVITGRAQLRHAAGGIWDEWYAAFSDGRWGWLAEAQGRFTMTFAAPLQNFPGLEELQVGILAPHVPVGLTVVEKAQAVYAAAEGEIPYYLTPGETATYADLSGPHGLFATLDYSDVKPVFYAGKEITLPELHLQEGAAPPKAEKRVGVDNLACPKCGGALALRAPDKTERVGCPYCGSLLDCSQGQLSIFHALDARFEKPLIELGSSGQFENIKLTVIGFMVRSCVIDGVRYPWREYLLYNPSAGFRWLVVSDGHWSYVKNVSPAEVQASGQTAYYKGEAFKTFQSSPAKVELVLGEFYWKVTIGETVDSTDFIAPPRMLSRERMEYGGGKGSEVAWSLGEYIPAEQIQSTFKLQTLPPPSGIGACQPNPHTGYIKPWLALLAAAFALMILFAIFKPSRTVLSGDETFAGTPRQTGTVAAPAAEGGPILVTQQFELEPRKMIKIEATAPLDNSWLALEGDLINDETGDVHPFDLNLEYYHGYEDGESWTEGSRSNYVFLSAVPAGKYTLRLEGAWDKMEQPQAFHLGIEQTGSRPLHFFLLLCAISVIPCASLILHYLFERTRWGEGDD